MITGAARTHPAVRVFEIPGLSRMSFTRMYLRQFQAFSKYIHIVCSNYIIITAKLGQNEQLVRSGKFFFCFTILVDLCSKLQFWTKIHDSYTKLFVIT